MRKQCMHSMWIVHILFINSKFCLLKSNNYDLKKKKKTNHTSENAEAESKLALDPIKLFFLKRVSTFQLVFSLEKNWTSNLLFNRQKFY